MLLPTRPIVRDPLVIRPYQPEDAPALVESVTESLEHLRPWMPWIAFEPQTVEQRREWIAETERTWADGGDLTVGVFIGPKLVGGSGLHRRRGPSALEIGYWIHAGHVGNGYATIVAGALTSAAFTLPEIEHVEIHHDKGNAASRRVPEKLGYTFAGEKADQPQSPGDTGFDVTWVMKREDWHGEAAWPD